MEQSFSARLMGRVNDQEIGLDGEGRVDPVIGRTIGDYRLTQIPDRFNPLLMGACLITGYPNVCATEPQEPLGFDPALLGSCILTGYPNVCRDQEGIKNPFADHPYHYHRTVDFGDAGMLRLETKVHYDDGQLCSTFGLEGSVLAPEIGEIEPIVETWRPGIGCIRGQFTIAWRTSAGKLFVGEARSEYYIDAEVPPLDRLLHRVINLRAQHEPGALSLHQDSALFH